MLVVGEFSLLLIILFETGKGSLTLIMNVYRVWANMKVKKA
jgi:hypothetical protein